METAYTATAAPAAGDALVVTASQPRRPDRVRVLGTGAAHVEIRTGGTWRHIGEFRGGYADLPAAGATADAVRLTWVPGSPAPSISEVVFDPAGR
jgi:hyaluronoglucosaminidase